jgi:thiol-disulfide isomerase/thioredoxin
LSHNQGLTIINLWATWCSPCVAELPYFGNIYKRYSKEQVHLYLLNIEGKDMEEKKLKAFFKEKSSSCPVYLLEDGYPTDLEKVLKTEISGALPTTLIYNSNGKTYKKFEMPITEEEIEKILKEYRITPIVQIQEEKSG